MLQNYTLLTLSGILATKFVYKYYICNFCRFVKVYEKRDREEKSSDKSPLLH